MAVQHITWGSPELLDQNRQNLLREYRSVLLRYEARYELPSAEVEKALASGALRETAEVCEWLIAFDLFQSIQDER